MKVSEGAEQDVPMVGIAMLHELWPGIMVELIYLLGEVWSLFQCVYLVSHRDGRFRPPNILLWVVQSPNIGGFLGDLTTCGGYKEGYIERATQIHINLEHKKIKKRRFSCHHLDISKTV